MSIIKDFTFNGRTASSFGVQLADNSEWWATPERDIEHISVPGRSGDLLIDNGRFNNIEITFEVNRLTDGRALSSLINWLALNPGYQRLSVSDDPDHYRMASFEGMTQPVFGQLKKSATVSLAFNCKPQRFLVAGEEGEQIVAGTPLTITNYGDDAKPVLVFNNNGDYTTRVTIVDSAYPDDRLQLGAGPGTGATVTIDSNSMEVFTTSADGRETHDGRLAWVVNNTWVDHFGDQAPFITLKHGHTYTFNGLQGSTLTIYSRRWEL